MMWRDCGPCYNTTHRGFVAGSGEQGGFRKLVEGRAQAVLVPFEFPIRSDLAINARTAAALGLSIPPALRLRADLVIE